MNIDIYYDVDYQECLVVVVEDECQNLWWIENHSSLLKYLTNIYDYREILHNSSSFEFVQETYNITHIASITIEDIPTIQTTHPELFI